MLEWPKSKTLPTPNAGKDVEQRELLFVAGGNAKWHSHVGDSVVVSYKTEHALPILFDSLVFTQRS